MKPRKEMTIEERARCYARLLNLGVNEYSDNVRMKKGKYHFYNECVDLTLPTQEFVAYFEREFPAEQIDEWMSDFEEIPENPDEE